MRGVSMTLTLIVLAGFYLTTKDHPTADSAAPHHAQLAKVVEQLPDRLVGSQGEWVVIDRPPVPPAAQQLLRPNALTARVLRNEALGAQASFIVVQCRDSRDMAGHYPPNCYPAHGWKWQEKPGVPSSVEVPLAGKTVTVPYQLYRFRQPGFPRERQIKIFSFFAIPGRGLVPDIDAVRKAAEDYRVRPYGAAQIQVIIDGGVEDAQAVVWFTDLMSASGDVVGALSRDPLLDSAPVGVERERGDV